MDAVTYTLQTGEILTLRPVSQQQYRSLSNLTDLPDLPEPPIQNYYDARTDQWVVFEYHQTEGHDIYERVLDLHDKYVLAETLLQRQIVMEYVISHGIIDFPQTINNQEDTLDWLWDRCISYDEYLDVIDAIVGINMPTESGVKAVLEGYQSIILDHGELIPLTEWQSKKERKGGLVMSLYAEGMLACSQMNGIITLKEYFALPGDPRYVDESSAMPLSMCHIIGLNRLNVKSSNATQEIELEKDDDKNKDASKFP